MELQEPRRDSCRTTNGKAHRFHLLCDWMKWLRCQTKASNWQLSALLRLRASAHFKVVYKTRQLDQGLRSSCSEATTAVRVLSFIWLLLPQKCSNTSAWLKSDPSWGLSLNLNPQRLTSSCESRGAACTEESSVDLVQQVMLLFGICCFCLLYCLAVKMCFINKTSLTSLILFFNLKGLSDKIIENCSYFNVLCLMVATFFVS